MAKRDERPKPDSLSVLIPIHNQSSALVRTASAWSTVFSKLGRDAELVFINDAGTDDTKSKFESIASKHPKVRLISSESRGGYGACIRRGIAVSGSPLVLFASLSEPHTPSDVIELLKRIEEKIPELDKPLDLVNGFRVTTPVPTVWKFLGALYHWFLRWGLGVRSDPLPGWLGWRYHLHVRMLRWMMGVHTGDPYSKFLLVRRAVLERFPIQSDGDFATVEIIAKANFLGCLLDELPVRVNPGEVTGNPESPPPSVTVSRDMRKVMRMPEFISPVPLLHTSKPATSSGDTENPAKKH